MEPLLMWTRKPREVHHAPEIRSWLVVKVAEYLAADARRRFLDGAGPNLRALFAGSRNDREGWAALGLFHEALELADVISGKGDLQSCWDIGRFTAKDEAGPVRSFALKTFRPAIVMSLTASLWQVHYRNAGRAVTQVVGPNAIKLSVADYPNPHRAHCLAVGGWIQGALELGPRRAIRVQKVACRCSRDPTCDYSIAWEQA